MTERIFDNEPLLDKLTAEIIDTKPCQDGVLLILGKTIFFPRGGGQPCDGGFINGEPVLDVFEENGEILHKIAHFNGEKVTECAIDLDKRRDNMRHHTCQHVISAVAHNMLDNPTIIARIEDDYAHIEFEKEMKNDELLALKREVLRIIEQKMPIKCAYFEPKEAEKLDIRGKITPHEHIRVVDIENFDKNACGGTHCADTGDILAVHFTGVKNVRGAFRLYFRAGVRALEDENEMDLRRIRIGKLLSTENDEQSEKAIFDMYEKSEKLSAENFELKKALLEADAERLSSCGEKIGDILFIGANFENRDTKQLRILAENILKEHHAAIAISNVCGDEMSVLLMQHKSIAKTDFGKLLKPFLTDFSGKGGGSLVMAQGMVKFSEDAAKSFEKICEEIKLSFQPAQD